VPYSLVETDQCFRGAYCLHHQVDALMMEALSTSEMSVSFCHTTWHNIPEDSQLQICKTNYSCVMKGGSEG
jgi:hypothetical protein